jgi:hypothetical protein
MVQRGDVSPPLAVTEVSGTRMSLSPQILIALRSHCSFAFHGLAIIHMNK